ncbi:MAG: hypothetical protein GTO63_27935 [Anaerolineae bacterium]|nr:hypothetical protein [Anaerolineae bacterium]NIN98576.1 hypothetical protein [Anaerolineae bacterium]NIQ81460.1 hypothetical protein [Anaerolineae bacterium]
MDIANGVQQAVPVTIVTGFLSVGRSNLVNRILNEDHGLRAAVLVNDFSEINIDAELVVGVESNVIVLANGCVCCQVRDDLVQALRDLLARFQPLEYILLEVSVAERFGISLTFLDPSLRDRIRLESVACVVDADQIFLYPDCPDLQQLMLREIGFSDVVILSNVDLLEDVEVETVKAWLSIHVEGVPIVEASYCDVPYEMFLGVAAPSPPDG